MFWWILGIIAIILIIVDVYKWFSRSIDKTGEDLGLSKKQTNSIMNLGALFHMGKNKNKKD